MWLRKQRLAGIAAKFQQNGIDGEALLTLEHADLLEVGITTIGQRAALLRIIGMVKKRTYCMNQATPICHGGTTTTSDANEDHMRRVLNAVRSCPVSIVVVARALSLPRLSLSCCTRTSPRMQVLPHRLVATAEVSITCLTGNANPFESTALFRSATRIRICPGTQGPDSCGSRKIHRRTSCAQSWAS